MSDTLIPTLEQAVADLDTRIAELTRQRTVIVTAIEQLAGPTAAPSRPKLAALPPANSRSATLRERAAQTAACPECGKTVSAMGLGAHRSRAHPKPKTKTKTTTLPPVSTDEARGLIEAHQA